MPFIIMLKLIKFKYKNKIKFLVMPQFSNMPDQILGKNEKNLNFQAKIWPSFRVLSSQNIRTCYQTS